MSTVYQTFSMTVDVWYQPPLYGRYEPVNDLRLRLHQLPQWVEPIETLVLVVGKLSPKIDLLDLSFECEALIR